MRTLLLSLSIFCVSCTNNPPTTPNPSSPPGSSSATAGETPPVTDTSIAASAYNQTCQQDTDCIAVEAVPNVCHACCNTDAINMADATKFKNDFDAKKKACGANTPCAILCKDSHAACVSGKCTLLDGDAR